MVTQRTLIRARAGDEDAFRELTDPYRREVELHCYRIVGSLQDAEDLLQETLLAAWRGLGHFEERASLRAWLYRIATNRCLNMLRDRRRRPREVPPMGEPPEPTRRADPIWLEPYPDVLLDGVADISPRAGGALRAARGCRARVRRGASASPATPARRSRAARRPRLSWRRGGGHARQRSLGQSRAAARAGDTRNPPSGRRPRARAAAELSARAQLVRRFVDAAERGDIDGIVSLLTGDAWLRCHLSRI